MSIFEYNGAAAIAVMGENCVCVATDTRLGRQQLTISTQFQKVFQIHPKVWLALTGLATDVQTVIGKLRTAHKLYVLKEGRNMSPQVFAHAVSNLLYSRRFGPYFVSPVIAGLGDDDKPFVCTMDSIGAMDMPKAGFVTGGTTGDELTGIAENLWREGLKGEDLYNVTCQSLLAAVDRDCLAGWGSEVILIEPHKVTRRFLKSRQD